MSRLRLKFKPFILKGLRYVPMPVLGIVIGVIAGLVVWWGLDQIQSRAVKKIFDAELHARLELRARESVLRFNQSLTSYAATTRLLANHRRLAQYLEPVFWFPEEQINVIVYQETRPFWLPDFFERHALLTPSHVVLADARGQVREIYHVKSTPLPDELLTDIDQWPQTSTEVYQSLTRVDQVPYLIVSDRIEDAGGYTMGRLIVIVPIDTNFLTIAEGAISVDDSIVALVDAQDMAILTTNEPQQLLIGSQMSDWSDTFLVTSQALPIYASPHASMLFATLIPQRIVDEMLHSVVQFERRQRIIAALAFITVFSLVIYLVSSRLNRILQRMTLFSKRALGIKHPDFQRGGNQLLLLEEWIRQFTQMVLHAREEMHRQHQHELRETEALKAAIMEASLDSIVTLNRAGAIIDFNPTAEKTFGIHIKSPQPIIFADHFLAVADQAVFNKLLQVLATKRSSARRTHARHELQAQRADRSHFPIELSLVPIDLDEQRVYTLYIHDITKRKQAEYEIKSLARFVSESPNPILRVNQEGVIVYANAASQALVQGWNTNTGQPVPTLWHDEITQTLTEGQQREREQEFGHAIYALLFVPIQELDYVNIYARDITAVRRAEQETRQHQAELVHVCRLSTMGEVATGMAHELNQPLSAIVNYANGCTRRLQNGLADSETLIDAMHHISTQARRASEIIRRLRALVGKQPPVRSQVDLNYLVREVCSFVEFETERLAVQIVLDLVAGTLTVNVDLVQIEQVLLNLVRNALDALSEDDSETPKQLQISTTQVDDWAIVAVRDNGAGIPEHRIPQLFDPFFTTKENGMGMGLPISQTILENHQGRIWAESTVQQGSCFYFRLPCEADAVEDAAPGTG
jgi:PAS domain S-box-containing protein